MTPGEVWTRAGATPRPERGAPDDRRPSWKRCLRRGLLLPVGWLILWLGALRPDWVESYYSQSLFPVVRGILRTLSGLSPLHLSELLLLLFAFVLMTLGVRASIAWLRGRRSFLNLCQHGAARLIGVSGIVYMIFLVSWGFNHSRQPYSWHVGLDPEEVQKAELRAVLTWLVDECNALRESFDESALQLESGEDGLDPRIAAAYEGLSVEVPVLSLGSPLLRRAYLSAVLSRLGISGIYSPFTAEAHINDQLRPYLLAFSSAHEIAHFKGFAREDEANFIAWQVCRRSTDPAIQYSGTLAAMLFATSALATTNWDEATRIEASLSPRVRGDIEDNRRFWSSKRTLVTGVAEVSNDLYLKGQGQREGRSSYGRMVDLIVAEWRNNGGRRGGD